MNHYLAPNLYLPIDCSLCDYPEVQFRPLGLKAWLTLHDALQKQSLQCLLLTRVTELCFGIALVASARYGQLPAGSFVSSTDSRLRRGFVRAPATCCGPVLVGKLPWGEALNPVPFPKELKTITQKKLTQDKS